MMYSLFLKVKKTFSTSTGGNSTGKSKKDI